SSSIKLGLGDVAQPAAANADNSAPQTAPPRLRGLHPGDARTFSPGCCGRNARGTARRWQTQGKNVLRSPRLSFSNAAPSDKSCQIAQYCQQYCANARPSCRNIVTPESQHGGWGMAAGTLEGFMLDRGLITPAELGKAKQICDETGERLITTIRRLG